MAYQIPTGKEPRIHPARDDVPPQLLVQTPGMSCAYGLSCDPFRFQVTLYAPPPYKKR